MLILKWYFTFRGGFYGSAHVSKSILSLASNQCYHLKNPIEM